MIIERRKKADNESAIKQKTDKVKCEETQISQYIRLPDHLCYRYAPDPKLPAQARPSACGELLPTAKGVFRSQELPGA